MVYHFFHVGIKVLLLYYYYYTDLSLLACFIPFHSQRACLSADLLLAMFEN